MAKRITLEFLYQTTLDQINKDLMQEYYKGKRKDKQKIAKLLRAKDKHTKLLKECQEG